MEMPWGTFGENLTTEGLSEEALHLGDVLRAGTAVLRVTQPRFPCFKLGIRFGRKDVIAKFLESGRSGFYFAIVEEGEVAAGDAVAILVRDPRGVSIAEFNELHADESPQRARLERILSVPTLPPGWRKHFEERLNGTA
jgi:MOSC domain-containing protein YiiM